MIEKHSKNKVKNQEEENIKKVNLVSEIRKALEKKCTHQACLNYLTVLLFCKILEGSAYLAEKDLERISGSAQSVP